MNANFCLNSQLDLFRGPTKQISQERNVYVAHYPLTSLSGGPIEFDIPSSPMYTDLSETRLYVKCKLTSSTGEDVTATNSVGPVNMMLHALFARVDVMLNGRLVTQSADTYPWKAALETILSFGSDAKGSQLASVGYYKDANIVDTNNSGLKKRIALAKNEFELMGPLHVDMFMQEKYLLNGVPIRVKLTRSPASFCLQSTEDDADYRLQITQAILYIRRVKISPSVEIAHAKAIEKCNALYPLHHTETTILPVASGLRSLTKDNLYAGKVPRKLVVAMISSDSYNGTFKTSPFMFAHNRIRKIDVTLEGESIADTPLTMDFSVNQYMRAYHNMFAALNKSYSDHGSDLTYKDFGEHYPLFCFERRDGCGNSTAHFEVEKQGTLRIHLAFDGNLANTIYVMFYAEFEKVLEITKTREVLT